jgi:hypothetical protein
MGIALIDYLQRSLSIISFQNFVSGRFQIAFQKFYVLDVVIHNQHP